MTTEKSKAKGGDLSEWMDAIEKINVSAFDPDGDWRRPDLISNLASCRKWFAAGDKNSLIVKTLTNVEDSLYRGPRSDASKGTDSD